MEKRGEMDSLKLMVSVCNRKLVMVRVHLMLRGLFMAIYSYRIIEMSFEDESD
jgi:hypothetical protein